MKANFDWTYSVDDYPNDRTSQRTLNVIAFGRRLTIAWSSPLRRHTGKWWELPLADDEDDGDVGWGDEDDPL